MSPMEKIGFTESAITQLKVLNQQHSKGVRLSIESGGCQGFNKIWNLDDNETIDDIILYFDDAKFLIDNISLKILGDSVIIDYKSSFDGSYFSVGIPSATSNCGCGTSFNI